MQNLTNQRDGSDRDYLNGKEDIHEKDIDFQRRVQDVYLYEAQFDSSLKIIQCIDEKGQMPTSEVVFNKLIDLLKAEKII
jgi:dTMP kinase